jgi:hypothetical protein
VNIYELQMEFFKTDSFNSYIVEPEGDHINGRLLAVFDATGIAGGVFRVACAAVDRHSFGFSGALLYCQPQLAAFDFIVDVQPSDIVFPRNLLATGWEDVAAAVAEKRIRVFNPTNPELDETEFRRLLQGHKDETQACFRWNINTHNDLTFSLDLQGLPMSASAALAKPALQLDTAPAIELASCRVFFPTFPSDIKLPGPAPTVFSDNPTHTESVLTPQSPLLCHEMARVAWHFTSREYVGLREAKLLLNSPREGKFSRPLCEALDHHSAPAAAQTFFSTPTPSDPASGKNIRSEECLNQPRKYPEHFPPLFRSAF